MRIHLKFANALQQLASPKLFARGLTVVFVNIITRSNVAVWGPRNLGPRSILSLDYPDAVDL